MHIDLKHIMKTANVKPMWLGRQLFPDHKTPNNAITRVARGKGFLNSWQIAKLAEVLNVPIGMLFTKAEWEMKMPAKTRIINFKAYDYFAELNLDTMETTVSKNGLIIPEKLTHPNGVELSAYLSSLTDLIIKYK